MGAKKAHARRLSRCRSIPPSLPLLPETRSVPSSVLPEKTVSIHRPVIRPFFQDKTFCPVQRLPARCRNIFLFSTFSVKCSGFLHNREQDMTGRQEERKGRSPFRLPHGGPSAFPFHRSTSCSPARCGRVTSVRTVSSPSLENRTICVPPLFQADCAKIRTGRVGQHAAKAGNTALRCGRGHAYAGQPLPSFRIFFQQPIHIQYDVIGIFPGCTDGPL